MEVSNKRKRNNKMNTLITTNKMINFTNRTALSFVIRECEFSLWKLARQAHSCFCSESDETEKSKKDKVIEIPINIVFKEAVSSEVINKPSKRDRTIIKTKNSIENICNCLEPIAKTNCNRFIFKTFDANLFINKIIFSRLLLNICYQLLANCKKNSAIEVVSYMEVEQYIIEFTTELDKTGKNKFDLESFKPLLEEINGVFSYETIYTGETMFKLSIPFKK